MLAKLRQRLWAFLENEDGPTAVEYAVMTVLIIVACLVAIQILGRQTNSAFSTAANSISATTGS